HGRDPVHARRAATARGERGSLSQSPDGGSLRARAGQATSAGFVRVARGERRRAVAAAWTGARPRRGQTPRHESANLRASAGGGRADVLPVAGPVATRAVAALPGAGAPAALKGRL